MRPTDALPHPEDWRPITVARSVELKRGISWSKDQEHSEPGAGRVPVIGIGNVQATLDLKDLVYLSGVTPLVAEKKRVTAGWTLLVRSHGNRSRIGNAVTITQDSDHLFGSFLLGARPYYDSGINPDYFYRWLSSSPVQGYISASSEGTTGLNNLSLSFFRAMTLAVPSIPEQEAIGRVLDAVDAALIRFATAVDQARILKGALLQRFFYEALGEIAYADRPRKDLPPGWSLVETGDLLSEDPRNGISPEASAHPPGTPTFSIAAIRDGKVDLDNPDNLKYVRLPEQVARKFAVRRRDILVVRGNANPNLVGRAGMVSEVPQECIYPDIVKRLTFRSDGIRQVIPEYGVLVWNHSIIHNQILRRAKTSNGTLKINNRDVKQIVMPVPPDAEQTRLVRLTSMIDANIVALRDVEATYRRLKSGLTHDLLTGRVRLEVPATAAAA